jgi:hypothetical protein
MYGMSSFLVYLLMRSCVQLPCDLGVNVIVITGVGRWRHFFEARIAVGVKVAVAIKTDAHMMVMAIPETATHFLATWKRTS